MMLNGLQTSSKTLPIDISAAKTQPRDGEATELSSFGQLLEFKERQLQQKEEISASVVAAAFASLQASQLAASLPVQHMETGEGATETQVSKASADAIPQTVKTSIEAYDLLPLTQTAAPHVGVTESIHPMFSEVFDTVPSTKSNASSAPGVTKLTEPAADNHVSTISAAAKASPSTFNTGTTTKIDVAGEAIERDTKPGAQTTGNNEAALFPNPPFQVSPKQEASKSSSFMPHATVDDRQGSDDSRSMEAQTAEPNKASGPGSDSGFVQPEINEYIRFHKDINTASKPLPVKTTEDGPTVNSPTSIGTESSTVQQARTSVNEQQSISSRPALSSSFSFALEIAAIEKLERISPGEDQSKAETLLLRNTIEGIGSMATTDMTEIPVSKIASEQQFTTSTVVKPRSIDITSGNDLLETPIEFSVSHEGRLPPVNTFVQAQDHSIRSYQSGIPTVTTQSEQSADGVMGANVAKNVQGVQPASAPVIDDISLAHARAGLRDNLAPDRIVNQLSVTQSKIEFEDTSQGYDVQAVLMSAPDKESTGTVNTFDTDLTNQKLNTESGDARLEAGEAFSTIETPGSSPLRDLSNRLSTRTENTLPNSPFAGASQGMEVLRTQVVEKEGSSETVEKKINIATESSNTQDTNSMNISSDIVMPTRPELSDREAEISLRTSSIAEEALKRVLSSDATSNLRASQWISGNTEIKSNQGHAAAEISVLDQDVVKSSEIPASGFEINSGTIRVEPNSKQKVQGSKTILGNPGAAAKSETPETTGESAATVSMDLLEEEKFVAQSADVESDRPADLTRHVLSKTYSILGSKNVAKEVFTGRESSNSPDPRIEIIQGTENQSSMEFQSNLPGKATNVLQDEMRISADGGLSEPIVNKNSSVQIAPDGKTPDTMSQVLDESFSQPEISKVVQSKNNETEIQDESGMNQPVQNGTTPFHRIKSQSDIETEQADFNTLLGKPDEKATTHIALRNDAIPATNQATGLVEMGQDPISSAAPKPYPVEDSHVAQKANSTDNDEKTLPVEKQPRLNQTPGSAAIANGPVKETMVTNPGKNLSSNQLHGDVKEVVNHVIRHIISNLRNGPTSMHLQLSPGELGSIDVQMVSDAQGVHVTFFAEQASTGKLLETQLDHLRVSLVESGVQLSGLDIGQHNQSGQKGGSFEQGPNSTRDFSRNFPEEKTVSPEKTSPERMFGRSSDIDYLI